MRTDSTRISEAASIQARNYLTSLFGAQYLAKGVQLYGKAGQVNTQDAHEAVRPPIPHAGRSTSRSISRPSSTSSTS